MDFTLSDIQQFAGYHFFADGGGVVCIANVGVAPIYRDAYVAVDGVRSDYSLRALMPGNDHWIKIDLPAVSEKSVITIECDHLVKGQTIQFQADVK